VKQESFFSLPKKNCFLFCSHLLFIDVFAPFRCIDSFGLWGRIWSHFQLLYNSKSVSLYFVTLSSFYLFTTDLTTLLFLALKLQLYVKTDEFRFFERIKQSTECSNCVLIFFSFLKLSHHIWLSLCIFGSQTSFLVDCFISVTL
jgi:hypothetical protein